MWDGRISSLPTGTEMIARMPLPACTQHSSPCGSQGTRVHEILNHKNMKPKTLM